MGIPGASGPGNNPGIRPGQRPSQPGQPSLRPANPSRPNIHTPGGSQMGGGANLPGGNRPGVSTLPGNISGRPNIPPIGTKPSFPVGNLPGGGINSPGTIRPGGAANLPGGPRPGGGINWPPRPGSGNGSGIHIGNTNRPTVNWKPGISNTGNINTMINNRPNNSVNINNVNQHNNTLNNFTPAGGSWGYGNNYSGGGYRSNLGRNGWFGAACSDYGSAYCGNYAKWNQGYHPWYNGCWNGDTLGWGLGTAALGFGTWGLSSMAYQFGYNSYANPFYTPLPTAPAYLNYTQPVINVIQAPTDNGQPPPLPESAATIFDAAADSFRQGNYQGALQGAEQAMKEFPKDPVMHEFRALCLFALGNYAQAASAVHSILASGPGWNWSTLSSLYPSTDVYAKQLNALEDNCSANPGNTSSLFLLAYHATTAGDTAMARRTLEKLKPLLPADPVVNNLWQAARGDQPVENATPKPEVKEPEPPKDIQLDITGLWKAPRQEGGSINLLINADGTFVWTIEDKAAVKKDSFDGTFTLDENLMALTRKTGGALMGRITALSETSFLFRMDGGPPGDPGLTFRK